MPGHNISELKAKEDTLELRRRQLLERFFPFRQGLLETLEQFTQEAEAAGLRSVKPYKKTADAQGNFQVTLTLNGFDLFVLSTDETHNYDLPSQADPTILDEPSLLVKGFFYESTDDKSTPFVEVFARAAPNSSYAYGARWFGQEKQHDITRGNTANKEEGVKTARALLDSFYAWERYWVDRPARKAILHKAGNTSRQIGFKSRLE